MKTREKFIIGNPEYRMEVRKVMRRKDNQERLEPAAGREAGGPGRSFSGSGFGSGFGSGPAFLAAAFLVFAFLCALQLFMPAESYAGGGGGPLLFDTWTDEVPDSPNDVIKTGQSMKMITLSGTGGNDLDYVYINLYGANLQTSDIARIEVYLEGSSVGQVLTSFTSLKNIRYTLSGNQKDNPQTWEFYLTLNDSAASGGKNVQFEVDRFEPAVDCYNNGLPFATKSCSIKLGCRATAPNDLRLGAKSWSSIAVEWSYDAQNNYYKVYRQSETETSMSAIASVSGQGLYNSTGLTELTKYGFIVNGYDTANACDSRESNTLISSTRSSDQFFISTCGGCHTTPPDDAYQKRGIPDGATIGRHANPYHTGGIAAGEEACAMCHNSPSLNNAAHRDGMIEMNSTDIYGQAGSYYDKNRNGIKEAVDNSFVQDNVPINSTDLSDMGVCRATWCHGSRGDSPVWGSSSGREQCLICHGMTYGTFANDTEGDTSPSDPQVGAHDAHLHAEGKFFLNISGANPCNECHIVPKKHTDDKHYTDESPAEVDFSNACIAVNGVENSCLSLIPDIGYVTATRTCTNVYCHNGQKFKNSGWTNSSQFTNPVWNNPNFLDSGTSANCTNKCHGYPPQPSHPQNTNCSGCHPSVSQNDAGFTPYKYFEHVDGVTQGYLCTSCHGQPPVVNATEWSMINAPDYKTGRHTEFPSGGAGRHETHMAKGFDCIWCHWGGGSYGQHNTDYDPKPRTHLNVGFNAAGRIWGFYQAPALIENAYLLTNGPGTTVLVTDGGRYCSTIYCHSDGGDYAGTMTYKGMGWDSSGLLACTMCHGSGNTYAITDRHPKHSGTYAFKCVQCHAGTVDASNAIISCALHSTGYKNVVLATGGANTTDGGSYNTPDCTGSYCHSPGNKKQQTYDAPVQTAKWNSTSLDCSGCHRGPADSAFPFASGSHKSHVSNAGVIGMNSTCQQCHGQTAVGNAIGSAATYIKNHVDRMVTVQFTGGANTTGEYNGTTLSKRDPGNAFATCSALYCHSTGKKDWVVLANLPGAYGGTHYSDPTWNGQGIDCNGCHGKTNSRGWPDYTSNVINNGTDQANSHAVGGHQGTFCGSCHSETVASATDSPIKLDSARHINGASVKDVILNAAIGGFYNAANRGCTNMGCHGNAIWGDVGGCTSCHGSPPLNESQLLLGSSRATQFTDGHGRHQLHDTAGITDCSTACHKGGGNGGAHKEVPKRIQIGFGFANVSGFYEAPQYSSSHSLTSGDAGTTVTITGSTRLCSGIYCHSNARPLGSGRTYTQVDWDGSQTSACNICHSQPSDATRSWSAPHDKHTKTYGAKYNCNNCHGYTALNNSTISNAAAHVNNIKNVTFNSVAGGSAWYDQASLRCSEVYCHSNGQASASYNAVAWSGTSVCTSCHGGANSQSGGAGTALSLSHAAHTNTVYNFKCQNCHTKVVDATPSITNLALHSDGLKNVSISNGSSAYYGANTSCTTTTCHGRRTRIWTSSSTGGSDACTVCHGLLTTNTADGAAFANRRAPGALGTGTDTNGVSAATNKSVGAHRAHLENGAGGGTTGYSMPVKCPDCHKIPGSVMAAGHLDDLPADITFSNLATNFGNLTPSYTAATGTCSGIYCHGYEFKNGFPGGTNKNPTWANTAYLTGSEDPDCARCHGNPPTDSGTHSSGGATDCSSCHPHVDGTDDGFTSSAENRAKHIDGQVQGAGDCVGCHDVATDGQDGGYTRRALASEWGGNWGHHRASRPAVKQEDCVVCHMEGISVTNPATNTTEPYHKNNAVDLRDPDTGDLAVSFGIFSRNLASNAIETSVTNLQNNHCLKCHDSDGASYLGTGTGGQTGKDGMHNAADPFAFGGGFNNLINVDAHFETTNASYHPVKGRADNSYCDQDTMEVPWNQFSKSAGTTGKWGNYISCFDCHAKAGATGTITNTVVAHGGSVTLRAAYDAVKANSYTALCVLCHKSSVYTAGGYNHGGTGSAWSSSTENRHQSTDWPGCTPCHGTTGQTDGSLPGRPKKAQNVHGFNTLDDGSTTAWPSGARPYGFIRCSNNMYNWNYGGSAGCKWGTDNMCGYTGNNTYTYTPGGTY